VVWLRGVASPVHPGFGVRQRVRRGEMRTEASGYVGVVGVLRDGGDVRGMISPEDASGHGDQCGWDGCCVSSRRRVGG